MRKGVNFYMRGTRGQGEENTESRDWELQDGKKCSFKSQSVQEGPLAKKTFRDGFEGSFEGKGRIEVEHHRMTRWDKGGLHRRKVDIDLLR